MNSTLKQRINTLAYDTPPNGYHKSKLGLMPDDWNICTLGSITSRISDKNGDNTTYPAYSINNQIGFIPQSEQFEEGSYGDLNKSSYKIVERGQFAYNPARINVGSIGVLKDCEKAIVSSLYVCFSVSDKVDQNYLENWFRTFDFFKEIIRNTEGSVREYLFYENFANIRMRLPPLAEQKKIAEILGCCDELIRLKKELIAEKKKQKKALMQKLLDPNSGFRLPGFSGEWALKTMNDISSSRGQYGVNAPAVFNRTDLPAYIRITDIDDAGKYIKTNKAYVDVDDSSAYLLRKNDVILVRTGGTVGKSYFYSQEDGNLIFAGFLIRFSIDSSKADIVFMKNILATNAYWKWVSIMSMRSGQPGINAEEYGVYSFMMPSLPEQNAIGKILSVVDHEIDLLEQELSQQERKKKSLMQLLLTGIVRVLA